MVRKYREEYNQLMDMGITPSLMIMIIWVQIQQADWLKLMLQKEVSVLIIKGGREIFQEKDVHQSLTI